MNTVNMDKLNFVAERLELSRIETLDIKNRLDAHYKELRQIGKSFNMSKGALKAWQDWFARSYEKRIDTLERENSALKERISNLPKS
jgi:hypothetical protein